MDVGGTKILAAVTRPNGAILGRLRTATPRECGPSEIVAAVVDSVGKMLEEAGISPSAVAAMGLAVPGIVGPDQEEVVFAPNLNISGANLVKPLKKQFGVPAVLGNDVNLGTLGEKWLGAAGRPPAPWGFSWARASAGGSSIAGG